MDPRLTEAVRAVRTLLPRVPQVGIVLGSGLGAFGESLEGAVSIPFSSIPHLPRPTVAGHAGNLTVGSLATVSVACLRGRVHLYEGHAVRDVVFGVRLLVALGCRAVLLTNAAGGIQKGLAPGSLLLVTDHLNLTGQNPIAGPSYRFVDMTHVYDVELGDAARQAARTTGVSLAEGVYAGLLGPSYETPAEVRMLRTLGADAVGMSTVLEAIALRALSVRVGAVSCITNLAAGISGAALSHHEVEQAANAAKHSFEALLREWVTRISVMPEG
ncbi:MAG TPA: purine-nucleoside phosphorylase [Polyangiaceae bacterium]|nr:purine-nucleoside phosphorylase [Polyangiaceae bacterium]